MGFTEKLEEFFNSKGLKRKRDIAKAINTNEQVLGRWLKANDLSVTFIERLTENFPDIDWNYILKNNNDDKGIEKVKEPSEKYNALSENDKLLEEIQERVDKLRTNLAQNCHKK